MCGIVGAVARREVSEILLEGLRRLEYRGYDSAGMALIDNENNLLLHKHTGKVAELEKQQQRQPILGCTGIAHTRWATHGKPSTVNAHPHTAGDRLALVHNGIIENHEQLRAQLIKDGCELISGTDSELVVHLLHSEIAAGASLRQALQEVVTKLRGAFALAVIDALHPDTVVATRRGSPLVIGVGIGENFLASDQLALRQVTDQFIYLEEGDLVELCPGTLRLWDAAGDSVNRQQVSLSDAVEQNDRGEHSHYMRKEIFEQAEALRETCKALDINDAESTFGTGAAAVFARVRGVQIVACGTSYHAGLVARYWLEEWAGIPCQVEVASEFRYRKRVQRRGTLLVTVSQSGETADSLAALRDIKPGEFIASLAIVNVANSSLAGESELVFQTRAGAEIGVASTKAFTTQLLALLALTMMLGKQRQLSAEREQEFQRAMDVLPSLVEETLAMDDIIRNTAQGFVGKYNGLFLGRGIHYPIAMEGALKLKEISYIHAEAYPAGELKHGPLALVDREMPVIAVAPNDELLEKLKSNLEEVRARGGELYVFADKQSGFVSEGDITVLSMPSGPDLLMPFIYTVALQLFAYHVAVFKGTDVDQPRNLAKSVTVE